MKNSLLEALQKVLHQISYSESSYNNIDNDELRKSFKIF